jgi:hypothetical protein
VRPGRDPDRIKKALHNRKTTLMKTRMKAKDDNKEEN